jgi:hypothetical protein
VNATDMFGRTARNMAEGHGAEEVLAALGG